MTRLVAAHEAEEILHILVVRALFHFGIEHAAGKLRGDRADEKVAELLVELFRIDEGGVELLGALEMLIVGVGAHLFHQRIPLLAHGRDIRPVKLCEIRCVEPRAQKGVFLGDAGRFDRDVVAQRGVHSALLFVKLTS